MSDAGQHAQFYVGQHAVTQRTIQRLQEENVRLRAENAALRASLERPRG